MPESLTELARTAARLERPEEGLRAIEGLRRALETLEQSHVDNAVRAGLPWSRVAAALGVTKQAAHKKHAARVRAKESREPVPEGERARLVVTGRARRSVRTARQEAESLGQRYLGTEHLLLGLLRDRDGLAAQALESLGVDGERARDAVERLVSRSGHSLEGASPSSAVPSSSPPGKFPISTSAREAMEQSLREAVRLGSGQLDVEHILLALLRAEHGAASRVLTSMSLSPIVVEQRLNEIFAGAPAAVSAEAST